MLVILSGLLITAVVGSVVTLRYFTRFPNRDQVSTVAAWIRTNTQEMQRSSHGGTSRILYGAADRRPASKYVHMLPLTTPGYSSPEQVAELVGHLEAEPPEAFIDAGSSAPGEPGWLPLLIPRSVLRIDGRELDLLDPLREFVREHYHLAEIVDGWPIYLAQLNGQRPCATQAGILRPSENLPSRGVALVLPRMSSMTRSERDGPRVARSSA